MSGRIRCTTFVVFVISLVLLIAENPAYSQDKDEKKLTIVGSVTGLEGRAKSQNINDITTQLDIESPIYLGDMIYTGWRSKVEVTFQDGTSITIGAKANMVIDEYTYNPVDKKGTCKTSLTRGAFKVLGGQISKTEPDKTMVKTPVAYIGIRGTTCIGTASSNQTTAIFTEGKAISVSNNMGSVILEGQSGMGCETTRGNAPGSPRVFSKAEVARISVQVTITHRPTQSGTAVQPRNTGGNARRSGSNAPRPTQPTNVRRPSVSHHNH